jgi:Tfp pilus assembly protein PilF
LYIAVPVVCARPIDADFFSDTLTKQTDEHRDRQNSGNFLYNIGAAPAYSSWMGVAPARQQCTAPTASARFGSKLEEFAMSSGDDQSSLLDITLQRAIIHHQAGRMPEAEQSYRDILQTEPNCPDANHNLGILMVQQGKVEFSLPHLRAALEGNPEKGQYWLSYAENLLVTREALGALAVLQKAKQCGLSEFAVNPLMSRVEEAMRSVISDSDGDTFQISLDERVFKVKPDFAEAHNALGNALFQLDKLDAAVTSYRRALALRPDIAELHNNLGRALGQQGRSLEEAEAACRRAIAIAPNYVEAHHNLGWALRKQGRLDEAEAACRRAIAIAPSYAPAYARLGQILCDRNRIKEACQSFARSAELSYGAPKPISPHKSRHDQEQRDYLTSIGIRDTATSDIFHLADGGELAEPALNPGDTNGEVSERWRRSSPKIVVIDDFLTNEALDGIRRFCWGSTVWRKVHKRGYLGAFPEHGFACPLLFQVADELRRMYPAVFASHPLELLWAFKYDSQLAGIGIHADFAAINVNFWITPDDANLDPKSGGLVIWDKAAPLDWEFAKYNADTTAALEFLAHAGARSVTVPYRSNRAVIFDSNLFHETDRIVFKEGYLNRRINITLLYGQRETPANT